jgi:hypothetical protein
MSVARASASEVRDEGCASLPLPQLGFVAAVGRATRDRSGHAAWKLWGGRRKWRFRSIGI